MGKGQGIRGNRHTNGFGCKNDTRSFMVIYFRLAWCLNRGKVAKYARRVYSFSRSPVLSNVSPTCTNMNTQYKTYDMKAM